MEKEIEELKKRLEIFLDQKKRLLEMFVKDSTFVFLPDETSDHFTFDVKKHQLKIPLSYFVQEESEDLLILWNIYFACAMYPMYRKDAEAFVHRMDHYQDKILEMTIFAMEENEVLQKQALSKQQQELIYDFCRDQVREFLYACDQWIKVKLVEKTCMVFQEDYYQKEIYDLLSQQGAFQNDDPFETTKLNQKIFESAFDPTIMKQVKPVFQMDFDEFCKMEFDEMIKQEVSIEKIDDWILIYVYDLFEEHLKNDVKKLVLEQEEDIFENKSGQKKRSCQMSAKEEDEFFQSLNTENQERKAQLENQILMKMDLDAYKLKKQDQSMYVHYVQLVQPYRKKMQEFWDQLIGKLQLEQLQRVSKQVNGYLNLDTLIQSYPDFYEAQQKGNYKNIRVFDRFVYEKQMNQKPKEIKVSFVVDNSGSMNATKLDYARRAIALMMLSLDDFSKRLKEESLDLSEMKISYEIILFGTSYQIVKEFHEDPGFFHHEANLIQTLSMMDGGFGSTDDGIVFKHLLERITPKQQVDLKSLSVYHLVFEISDGATSFPGTSKKYLDQLLEKGVMVQGILIGPKDPAAKKVFDYVFNEGQKDPHGISIQEEIEKLPDVLCSLLKQELNKIIL